MGDCRGTFSKWGAKTIVVSSSVEVWRYSRRWGMLEGEGAGAGYGGFQEADA